MANKGREEKGCRTRNSKAQMLEEVQGRISENCGFLDIPFTFCAKLPKRCFQVYLTHQHFKKFPRNSISGELCGE